MNCPKSYRQRRCGTKMITTIQNTIGITAVYLNVKLRRFFSDSSVFLL